MISAINGRGPQKVPQPNKIPNVAPAPSFGQRARGLVESFNIPAAEVAAVVVAGGIFLLIKKFSTLDDKYCCFDWYS
jgi:hypothetical protein